MKKIVARLCIGLVVFLPAIGLAQVEEWVSPNPFNNQTIITFKSNKSLNNKNISFIIYNVLGQVVRTFKPDIKSDQKAYQFAWDGKNNNNTLVSSGNYFFVVQTAKKQYKLKNFCGIFREI